MMRRILPSVYSRCFILKRPGKGRKDLRDIFACSAAQLLKFFLFNQWRSFRRIDNSFCGLLMAVLFGFIGADTAGARLLSDSTNVVKFKSDDDIHEVFAHNESVQAQMLEAAAGHRKARGERGIFEPAFEASVTREANTRANRTEQQAAGFWPGADDAA